MALERGPENEDVRPFGARNMLPKTLASPVLRRIMRRHGATHWEPIDQIGGVRLMNAKGEELKTIAPEEMQRRYENPKRRAQRCAAR
jgi:hypothetical protein